MGKYNEKDNDNYLLKNNLLEINSFDELERAEAVVFSLRATALEQENFMLNNFTLKEFKELHHYLYVAPIS